MGNAGVGGPVRQEFNLSMPIAARAEEHVILRREKLGSWDGRPNQC